MPIHIFEGIKINKKFPPCYISYALSSRTSISENFSLERQKPFNHSHSCHLTADGIFNGMEDCIFSALSSTRKRGDEVLFRKHAMTSKRRLYPLTCVLNLPETGSGRPIFRDIIYLLRQHSCLPQDNFLQAHANSQKCLL